jgi:hypothetical protein
MLRRKIHDKDFSKALVYCRDQLPCVELTNPVVHNEQSWSHSGQCGTACLSVPDCAQGAGSKPTLYQTVEQLVTELSIV